MPRDRYKNFAQLVKSEREGFDFRIVIQPGSSNVLIIAPHGGGIEPGTSEIATAVAGEEHTLYCFEGIKRTENRRLHITSTNFDEPQLLELLQSTRHVIAFHGCEESVACVYVGGLDQELAQLVSKALQRYGFTASESSDLNLAGREPKNICNRGLKRAGLQLEVSEGLRTQMFKNWRNRSGRKSTTKLFKRFVTAIGEGITGLSGRD